MKSKLTAWLKGKRTMMEKMKDTFFIQNNPSISGKINDGKVVLMIKISEIYYSHLTPFTFSILPPNHTRRGKDMNFFIPSLIHFSSLLSYLIFSYLC